MRFYSDVPARRTAAILGDLLVLILLALLAWLGLWVHDTVAELASVPRGVTDAGGAIRKEDAVVVLVLHRTGRAAAPHLPWLLGQVATRL